MCRFFVGPLLVVSVVRGAGCWLRPQIRHPVFGARAQGETGTSAGGASTRAKSRRGPGATRWRLLALVALCPVHDGSRAGVSRLLLVSG